MKILDGKKLQKICFDEIKNIVSLLEIKPKLCVISIGDDKMNQVYFKQIEKMCLEIGFDIDKVFFEAITETSLLALIDSKNLDSEITGILVLGPLPFYLNEDKIYNSICLKKDVEGLSLARREKMYLQNEICYSCTALSIISLLEFHNIDVDLKNVVIINRSNRIGKPLFSYFLNKNCTVTMLHSKSKEISSFVKNADIVISAVGNGILIDSDILKEGSTVVDLGMFYQDGKIIGDINISNNKNNFNYLCHTGGVGPMTVACLAKNVLSCYYLSLEDK